MHVCGSAVLEGPLITLLRRATRKEEAERVREHQSSRLSSAAVLPRRAAGGSGQQSIRCASAIHTPCEGSTNLSLSNSTDLSLPSGSAGVPAV